MKITEIENTPPTLEQTLEFIKKAHEGQKYGGKPYWNHPVAVMSLLPASATEDEKHAALLHDTIEDTGTTDADLREMGYNENIITMVKLLSNNVSKPASMTYLEWIEKVIVASGNKGAMRVKYADNKHNLSTTGNLPPEKQESRTKRYSRSMEIIEKGLGL